MKTTRTPRFDDAWHKAIAMYPDENDRRALTEAIRKYQLDGIEPDLPPALMVAFAFLRPTIDRRRRNAEKARNRREMNRKNATTSGGRESKAHVMTEPRKLSGNPTMLTDMYGARLLNDKTRLLHIASESGRRCRKRVTVDDVIRNISFFNDYLFHSTEKVDSEEAYVTGFQKFLDKLMQLPDIPGRKCRQLSGFPLQL